MSLVLNSAQRLQLAELVRRASGLLLKEPMAPVVERRLAPRLEHLGLDGFAAYLEYLEGDPRGEEELHTAIELLFPKETYFFREPHQLRCLEQEVLPLAEAHNRASRALRVWSAGCSTGEEVYTAAFLLADRPSLAGWAVSVLGTDRSRPALAHARRAEYGPASLRAAGEETVERYFERCGGDRVRVKERYRAVASFQVHDLLVAEGVPRGPFDIILCRNVLVYLDDIARTIVLERLFHQLAPGGVLLLGHAEHLLSLPTRFERMPLDGDLVYRRPVELR